MKSSRLLKCFLLATLLLQLIGCGSFGKGVGGPPQAQPLGANIATDPSGPPVFQDYPVQLDYLIVLAVHGDGRTPADTEARKIKTAFDGSLSSLEAARRYFYDHCGDATNCAVLRDRVQDRLIWASEASCSDYLISVRQSFARTNLNFGSATTVLGALGSVLTSADATRVFSGAAAVSSGLRAEFNDVYFSSQAFELISKSIRSLREKSLKEIRDGRVNSDIKRYTLDGAVSDAIRYHSKCNVIAGLEEASEAVTRQRDPGLQQVNALLQSVGAGVNVALGTAALDTGSIPSAAGSCTELNALAASGMAVIDQLTGEYASAQKGTDEALKAASKSKLDKATQSNSALAKFKTDVDGDCTANTGSIAKAEVSMFDAIREFQARPLSEKASARDTFNAKRAAVIELKNKIDVQVARARTALQALEAIAKGS